MAPTEEFRILMKALFTGARKVNSRKCAKCSGLQQPGYHRGRAMRPGMVGSVAFLGRALRSRELAITVALGCAVQRPKDGSSGADRLRTAPATAGEALSFASSARSWTATCDSVCSPAMSTSPMIETIQGPTSSRRR